MGPNNTGTERMSTRWSLVRFLCVFFKGAEFRRRPDLFAWILAQDLQDLQENSCSDRAAVLGPKMHESDRVIE